MGVEIERRFLVDGRNDKPWRCGKSSAIFQTYLDGVKHIDGRIMWRNHVLVEESRALVNLTTWRIRLSEGVVTLTAKGRRIGASAPEFEWDLPLDLILRTEACASFTVANFNPCIVPFGFSSVYKSE